MVCKAQSGNDERMDGQEPEAPQAHMQSAQPAQPAVHLPQQARGVPRARRERLDVLLVERGLAPSRERARALIMAGDVRVDGRLVDKAGTLVLRDATCEVVGPAAELKFVSRGGLKLERALDAFELNPTGCVCLDVGASTGGFTDVLLRRGALRVYAIDVGRGQLAWTLRTDPRVVVMDRTNIRHVDSLPEPADCAVIDVSFISLRIVLPHVAALLRPGSWIVALVKPQFEAGRAEADRGGGVIADPQVHRRVLRELVTWASRWRGERTGAAGAPAEWAAPVDGLWLAVNGLTASPITGREGNHEYLLWLIMEQGEGALAPISAQSGGAALGDADIERVLHDAFAGASGASI
jgi:23S rRNA (cytidine1920-2'-O)/16S rRNA (cytidine1409-2'-O)-methyltransferase